jgi:AraC-like DNA-binding protein
MQTDLIEMVTRLAPENGRNPTAIPRVSIYRETGGLMCPKCLYEPILLFVLQGEKHYNVVGKRFVLTPADVLLVPLPMPVEAMVVGASEDTPFFGLTVAIDMFELKQLLQDIPAPPPPPREPGIVETTPVTADHRDALTRLLKALESETDARVIGPQICRELVYYVLREGPAGALASLLQNHGTRLRISQIINEIHTAPERRIDTTALVDRAQMSKSAFFALFKDMTGHSPIQYQKTIRLHRARAMILSEGRTVSETAYSVGYASASQFSRDYARFFNTTAREDLLAQAS